MDDLVKLAQELQEGPRPRMNANPAPVCELKPETLPVALSIKQAAQVMNVPERTMNDLCRRGDVKAVKCANRWRVNRDALLAQLGY